MIYLPNSIQQRNEIDCRLGIKSSLGNIPSVVALAYILFCANGKQSQVDYANEVIQSNGKKKLELKPVYKSWIKERFAIDESDIDNNPLLTSQLEALQVGLGLLFRLAKISYVDYPNSDTKERAGGERFKKIMKFAINMKLLDVYLSSFPEDMLKEELSFWLNNRPSDSRISQGLKQFLTSFSEETQFKIRTNGQEIIFQQEGIYQIISSDTHVIGKDEIEDVGPFRIFKSFVRDGLHPFITLGNNEFSSTDSEEFANYKNMVETGLSLMPKKTIIYQEVPEEKEESTEISPSHQIIYYGAPGTGKSHGIKMMLGEYEGCPEEKKVPKQNIFRTTFHPDSDYSTFVGAYKPFVEEQEVRAIPVILGTGTSFETNKGTYKEKRITYRFVPQAFLKAYIRAYEVPTENVYLVIEEINRGNCAQIFGDLFQLLDRDKNGKSEYTIKADDDLKTFLEDEFKKLGVGDDGIKDGELCLPSNLYIYATMNTSDQSLFPIDSAFKRRWDWEYEPIKYKNTDWIIKIDDDHKYKWVDFQKEVNDRIFGDTSSEDKMLGDYFVNPSDKIITKSMLLNKILFYLWNDVCKDGEGDIFTTDGKNEVTFSELYRDDSKLIAMMEYLKSEYEKKNPSKEKSTTDPNSESTTE